jgi:hypothetical protein
MSYNPILTSHQYSVLRGLPVQRISFSQLLSPPRGTVYRCSDGVVISKAALGASLSALWAITVLPASSAIDQRSLYRVVTRGTESLGALEIGHTSVESASTMRCLNTMLGFVMLTCRARYAIVLSHFP